MTVTAAIAPDWSSGIYAPVTRIPWTHALFDTPSGANRHAILYRVQTAKKAETRAAWIEKLVGMCGRGETVH